MLKILELLFYPIGYFVYKPYLALLVVVLMIFSFFYVKRKKLRLVIGGAAFLWLAFVVSDFSTPINAIRADLILWIPLIGLAFYIWVLILVLSILGFLKVKND